MGNLTIGRLPCRFSACLAPVSGRILSRLPSIQPWKERALSKAQRFGTYSVVADLIIAAARFHEEWLRSRAGEFTANGTEIDTCYSDAVLCLSEHVTALDSAEGNDAGDNPPRIPFRHLTNKSNLEAG